MSQNRGAHRRYFCQVFSETYTRWFRDIAPPSDDIPISLALSDANHAATIAQEMLGPVHLNIQFRENLAPEGGPIRGDNRDGSMTSFSASRFTDVPRFQQWSIHGKQWTKFYGAASLNYNAFHDVATLIAHSERGIIVVGNIRNEDASGTTSHSTTISAMISDFATFTGFPVFGGAQSADIRFQSSAVVPYAGKLICPLDYYHNPTQRCKLTLLLVVDRTFTKAFCNQVQYSARSCHSNWVDFSFNRN